MKNNLLVRLAFLSLLGVTLFPACAGKKKIEDVTLRNLVNKQVALAEVKGSPESVKHVEVAILNEIAEKGRFLIVDRTTVREALTIYPTEHDYLGLGKKVGADYVLAVTIKDFSIKERKGYDKVTEEDSVLTQESGETKTVVGTRYVKVKSYEGKVRLACTFFDVANNVVTYQGEGVSTETRNSRDENFPRKMAFLEELSAQAIGDFFQKIPK